MNSTDTKITTPFQLRRKLAVVDTYEHSINSATRILRSCEWKLVKEMKETLRDASYFTELGTKNDHLLSICTMLLEWVQTFYGEIDPTIEVTDLANQSIDELLAPYDKLYKILQKDAQSGISA